eukprot:CAMPEP_0172837576 /NCGR_PEP_ID=MMETSP1075-20121228/27296_1 /TAXON_ID=2916 /ORGANISM="Ceratium fusus, Strain PA161109" /LENGTH=847 /DNA_ID=CAMNT_0013680983 /DNA_START=29 /DNA_END=2569 /DNA_ORIENTATION=+
MSAAADGYDEQGHQGQSQAGQAAQQNDVHRQSSRSSTKVKSIGHYILMKTIGEGTFGKVKLGYHILTGERVAVKVLEKERIVNVDDVERVAREIHILKLIRASRHIIQLYEIIETPHQLYLIMEYACGGELFDYIVQHGRAEEREACRFLHQILAGVEQVHEMRVCHRDLKPENLLLDDRRDIKIVDFGLSNTYQEGQLLQTACGSPCYAAPEMIAGQLYAPPGVDIWSCGVILFALVCGYLPFEDQNHTELYKKILAAEYEMPNFVSAEVADLIRCMLTTDPAERFKLDGIRQHAWYRQIPEASLRDREDTGNLDEDILEQLDSYGFPRDYAVKCLKTNKHNHVTTTYHLIKEKRLRSTSEGKQATSQVIADLDATAAGERDEDPCNFGGVPPYLGTGASAAAAVAAVATPSRGVQAEAEIPASDRHQNAIIGLQKQGWVEGSEVGGRLWPGGGANGTPGSAGPMPGFSGCCAAAVAAAAAAAGSLETPSAMDLSGGVGTARSQRGAVPKLNLGDLSQGGSGGPGAERQGSGLRSSSGGQQTYHGHRGTAVGSRSPRTRHSSAGGSRSHREVGGDARCVSLGRPHTQQPGTARASAASPHHRRPRSGEPPATQAATIGTPRAPNSMSARGGPTSDGGYMAAAPPRRRASGSGTSRRDAQGCNPWGGPCAGWPDPANDLGSADTEVSPWRRPPEAPLTARPRLQGNAGGWDRSTAWGPGSNGAARSNAYATRGTAGRAPQTARSGSSHDAAVGCDDLGASGPGTFQVSCSSKQTPRHIVQEVLRSLAAHGISYRQISNFMVRCQVQSLRFQAEVVQLDRGSGYALRLARVSGDIWHYKEICARLLSE